jgi:hypothetical protein
MKLKIFSGIVFILVCIQFIHNKPNDSDDQTHAIWNTYPTSPVVMKKLNDACLNCHSNKTNYPWYASYQPIAYWMNLHIDEGKKHFNLSDFTSRSIARQNHQLEEMVEMIEEGEMPLPSYTYLGMHPEAKLTEEDKELLIHWARSIRDTMKANYPADSFILKKRK